MSGSGIIRPLAARIRSVRRPFHPSTGEGRGYRLPHDIRDRLAASLAPFRNREAAFALAVFLARFWSVPGRVSGSFPIDRRALTDHVDLQLTEARVRGAIKTLEAVGFLERAIPAPGSAYKPTANGRGTDLGKQIDLAARSERPAGALALVAQTCPAADRSRIMPVKGP